MPQLFERPLAGGHVSGGGARSLRALAILLSTWLLILSNAARAADKSGLSPDRLHLPKGPGSLEGVGENVEPNFNMGLMSYRVPIDVPKGYPGVTPELGLAYNSGGGNSEVGIGWTLAVPTIERMTSRGLPRYDEADTFAANGSEELVRVSSGGVYRARYERSFVRYTWVDFDGGTEGYWTAEYPDGRIGYFGASADGSLVPSARDQGRDGVFRYHLVDMVDVYAHVLHYAYEKDGEVARLTRISYVFDGATARYQVRFAYEPRVDSLSDAKAGALLQWSERLAEIRVLVRGVQLKRYELAYEDEDTSGGFSRLSRVRWFGSNDEGPFPIQFRFTYSAGLATSTPSLVTVGGALGLDFRTGTADLVDLNSDGLPDVIDTSQAEQRIFLNEFGASGAQRFRPPVASAVGTLSLLPRDTEMFDLDGDGQSDMVDAENRVVLWNKGAGDWDSQVELASLNMPSLAADANLKFFDYDNDKRTDLIHADRSASWVYVNQGDGSFTLVDSGLDAIGASFVEDNLQLADMNGDGLQDLVRKATDLVAYRTNLGFGHWTDWVEMAGVPANLAGDEQLVDLNGDSLADLVAVRADAVIYFVNRDGATFAPEVSLRATSALPIPERTSEISVRFADMNGSGSTDIVWVNASGAVSYLELFPERPNLLTRVDNGIGKVIDVDYGSSSEHLRRDDGDWSLRLPHPMLTVDEIVVRDELSGVEQRQTVHYRNGFYDGVEKQFRGFRDVTVETPGDDSVDTGVRQISYDVGEDDAYRKGLMLSERLESAGRVLVETEHSYEDCPLTRVPETTPAVRFVCPSAVVQVKEEGRPESEWVTIEERYQYDGYGNRTLTEKLGVTAIGGGGCDACRDPGSFGTPCGRTCSGDESYQSSTFIAPSSTSRWILGRVATTREYSEPESDVYRERSYYYDGRDFVGLANGELELGALTRVSAKRAADSDETIDVERYARDANGVVVESLDPDGRRRAYEYDADSLLITAESVLLEDADAPYSLRMSVEYDPVLEQITRSTAWMRVTGETSDSRERPTEYGYDVFGRLAAITRPGDSSDAPTEEYSYDIAAPVSSIVRRARSEPGGELDLEEVQCFDGLGRSVQKRTRVDVDRYDVSGYALFNTGGSVWQAYQQYGADSAACDTSPPRGVEAQQSLYDATGRVLRVRRPDAELYGSASVAETEYFPLRILNRDEEDTLASGPEAPHANTPEVTYVDGLGRTVALDRYLAPDEPLRTEVLYDGTGELAGLIDADGNRRSQTRDLLGRVLSVDDPDSGITSYEYDGAGNVIARTDARDVRVRVSYDRAGRKLAEWEDGNEDATRIDYVYDARSGCDDCTNLEGALAEVSYPLAGDRSERGVDEFGYDDRARPTYLARTLGGTRFEFRTEFDNVGRVARARYPGGLNVRYTHDGAGRVTAVDNYAPEVSYDERGRLASVTLGNGVTSNYGYDPLDRLASIDTVAPGDVTLQATRFERDRLGNVLSVTDDSVPGEAPSVNAGYRYDALYRLTRAHLDPERDADETLDFAYDALDNLLSKTSDRESDSPDHVGDYGYGGHGAGPHAVTSAGGSEFRYDAAGHLTERDANVFTWDFLGRLVESAPGGEPGARFWYGAGDDRVKKSEQGKTSYYLTPDFEVRDGAAVLYVRVGGQRIAKLELPEFAAEFLPDLAPATLAGKIATPDPDGEITAGDAWVAQAAASGVFELDADVQDATVDELLGASARRMLGDAPPDAAKVTYFHHDQLGSVVAVTNADGELVERRASYPFGLDRSGGPPGEVDYAFTGKERDAETGFVYAGARYLNPRLGVWTAPDPQFALLSGSVGFERLSETLNRYGYCAQNPIVLFDPGGRAGGSGLFSMETLKKYLPAGGVSIDVKLSEKTGFSIGLQPSTEGKGGFTVKAEASLPKGKLGASYTRYASDSGGTNQVFEVTASPLEKDISRRDAPTLSKAGKLSASLESSIKLEALDDSLRLTTKLSASLDAAKRQGNQYLKTDVGGSASVSAAGVYEIKQQGSQILLNIHSEFEASASGHMSASRPMGGGVDRTKEISFDTSSSGEGPTFSTPIYDASKD